jgi:hypothetical protein
LPEKLETPGARKEKGARTHVSRGSFLFFFSFLFLFFRVYMYSPALTPTSTSSFAHRFSPYGCFFVIFFFFKKRKRINSSAIPERKSTTFTIGRYYSDIHFFCHFLISKNTFIKKKRFSRKKPKIYKRKKWDDAIDY